MTQQPKLQRRTNDQMILRKLSRMSDELSDLVEVLHDDEDDRSDAPSNLLNRAKYLVEDVSEALKLRKRVAVGEAVNAACHQHGIVGPVNYEVMGERVTI